MHSLAIKAREGIEQRRGGSFEKEDRRKKGRGRKEKKREKKKNREGNTRKQG